ncbi:MAG: diguanylate cyclase [Chitinispirillales bacterium]|jgi:diguanylate cyclase (GGDEF)-like protein|nr:diguanylate cyclase [Chitinispirillales bacterium]
MATGSASVGRSILVVDGDPSVRDFLAGALRERYDVALAAGVDEAVELIGASDFDLVITDLGLPDATGLTVLACAKSRDEFVEVLMISGNATVDSAAAAVNNGAGSYLLKPFALNELRGRVEKMMAMRAFHLKSLMLMKDSDLVSPAVKGHVDDLASLYHFTRKLTLTLEISEVMRITLEEANCKADAKFCTIEVCLPDYREIYSMPQAGEFDRAAQGGVFVENWADAFVGIDKERFQSGAVPHYVYRGRRGEFSAAAAYKCLNFPLVVTGKTIGSLTVWLAANADIDERRSRYLHILTSFTSPVIEHVYLDLQTRLQAKTDNLTGIANHRYFYEALEREIARANRKKSVFALLLADIDDFKAINDTYGHQTGDAVIVDLAKRVSENIRTGDVAARYGGEEFGVILPESDPVGALAMSKRICESISGTPYAGAKHEIPYTASFGLACYDGNNPVKKDELILSADSALYKSKTDGKNRVTVAELKG